MKVFTPSRVGGFVFVFGGAFFVLVGGGGLIVGFQDGRTEWGGYLFFLGFFVAGLFCSLAGVAQLAFRIGVDSSGMVRSSWLGCIVHRDSWASLKSWTIAKIEDDDIPDRYFVNFDFEGLKCPIRMDASVAVNPGFDAFVEEIRSHAASKEVSPNIQRNTTST
jgi:hypothetical protein